MLALTRRSLNIFRAPTNQMPRVLVVSHEPVKTRETSWQPSGYSQAITALSVGLERLGVPVAQVVPFYNMQYRDWSTKGLTELGTIEVKLGTRTVNINVMEGIDRDGTPTIFLEKVGEPECFAFSSYRPSWNPPFVTTNQLVGKSGNYSSQVLTERVLIYNLALLELAKVIRGDNKDVIFHGNDHITASATALAAQAGFPTVFTIHNPAYSTLTPNLTATTMGLDLPFELQNFQQIDLLALAMLKASFVTTVSPAYAKEIGTSDFNYGPTALSYGKILERRQDRFVGILNSLPPTFLTSRKHRLRHDGDTRPTFLFAGRLAPEQKGYEFLTEAPEAMYAALDPFMRFSIVASGDNATKDFLSNIEKSFNRTFSYQPYSESTLFEELQFADVVVMPSKFEPCGLLAETAQANGVLLLATPTGGLRNILNQGTERYGLSFPLLSGPRAQELFWGTMTTVAKRIMEKDQALEAIRQKAQERAAKLYRPERMAKDYLDQVYAKVLQAA